MNISLVKYEGVKTLLCALRITLSPIFLHELLCSDMALLGITIKMAVLGAHVCQVSAPTELLYVSAVSRAGGADKAGPPPTTPTKLDTQPGAVTSFSDLASALSA